MGVRGRRILEPARVDGGPAHRLPGSHAGDRVAHAGAVQRQRAPARRRQCHNGNAGQRIVSVPVGETEIGGGGKGIGGVFIDADITVCGRGQGIGVIGYLLVGELVHLVAVDVRNLAAVRFGVGHRHRVVVRHC